jgi:V-type H+-transporting ATPase subunit a
MITNTYGVPDYKEVNPSIFGCVSFPFLFGVMYGDIGHGICLFFVSSMLVLFGDTLKKGSMKGIADV